MIAYILILLGILLLYALLVGNGKAVFSAILGRSAAGNPSAQPPASTQEAGVPPVGP